MRFSRLELVRYGGFADRTLDFGSGKPDLHLVVGPNEAGKSTLLAAIGDLLFGIAGQTPHAWRYDYTQLRLRALIEHDGTCLDLIRRKGNKDTLLRADGTAFAQDPLAPLLAGIDRGVFERMFGLDHTQLRAGGEAILQGKDEAARIVLEAGTGLSSIGTQLADLETVAASLFKPAGQVPTINKLLRERSDAVTSVKQTMLSESALAGLKSERSAAFQKRNRLIEEAHNLDTEAARTERINRTRRPLAKLASAQQAMAELGDVPALPGDAAAQLQTARSERATATELQSRAKAALQRAEEAIAGIHLPAVLLAARSRVEDLGERRPVYEKTVDDLQRRSAELKACDQRIEAARSEATLPAGAPLPSAGWRRRVADHLANEREAASDRRRHDKDVADLVTEQREVQLELNSLPEIKGVEALELALHTYPSDGDQRLGRLETDASAKAGQAKMLLDRLQPWQGSYAALADLVLPASGEVNAVRQAMADAQAGIRGEEKEVAAQQTSIIEAEKRLQILEAGESLPTADAIASARSLRDAAVLDVRQRLSAKRSPEDHEAGETLAAAIVQSDSLVDRRAAEAARVADYVATAAAITAAVKLKDQANERLGGFKTALADVQTDWGGTLSALGFSKPVLPEDFAAWLAKREAALTALAATNDVKCELEALQVQTDASSAAVAEALRIAGFEPNQDRALLLHEARQRLLQIKEVKSKREAHATNLAILGQRERALAGAKNDLERDDDERKSAVAGLLAEAQFSGDLGLRGLTDASAALEAVAEDIGKRGQLATQVSGMTDLTQRFREDVAALLADLGKGTADHPPTAVRQLTDELTEAVKAAQALATQEAEKENQARELAEVDRRLKGSWSTIHELMVVANTESEPALEAAIFVCVEHTRLRAEQTVVLEEIAEIAPGGSLEQLRAEVAALQEDEAAAQLMGIAECRNELSSEREDIGRQLNDIDRQMGDAASATAAADAQQTVADAGAVIAIQAEHFIHAAGAAAVLRWLIDKHRATRQAPLIARSGALFEQVTCGAFKGLQIAYDSNDRPTIVGVRADGAEVDALGMSEGTRDQLFLSLRLGSIQERAGAGSLPLVCDDLLITADDERAGAMVKALSTVAARCQVIIFSHHEHVIEVANKAVGEAGFCLHRIQPATAANAA